LATAVVRGESPVAMLLVNAAFPLKQDGAPIDIVYPVEGMPANPGGAGMFKTAANPNAAKLFLNWFLSIDGQNTMVEKLGFASALKGAKVPPGASKDVKIWYAPQKEYAELRDEWIKEWNEIYNYR